MNIHIAKFWNLETPDPLKLCFSKKILFILFNVLVNMHCTSFNFYENFLPQFSLSVYIMEKCYHKTQKQNMKHISAKFHLLKRF